MVLVEDDAGFEIVFLNWRGIDGTAMKNLCDYEYLGDRPKGDRRQGAHREPGDLQLVPVSDNPIWR